MATKDNMFAPGTTVEFTAGRMFKPPTVAKPSKTEQRKAEEAAMSAALKTEVDEFIERTTQSEQWKRASVEQRSQYLNDWEKTTFPEYAKQRFGNDTTAANAFKNSLLQPLRRQVGQQKREIEGWGNTLYNMWQSAGRGLDTAYDSILGIPLTIDAQQDKWNRDELNAARRDYDSIYSSRVFYPDDATHQAAIEKAKERVLAADAKLQANAAELQSSLQRLATEQALSVKNEAVRRAANPQRADDARRDAEILEKNPEAITALSRLLEGQPRAVINLVMEQWANMGITVAGSLGGGAVGSLAGPGGTVAGGAAGGALASAVVTAGNTVNELAQEVLNAPIDKLRAVPRYAELEAQGLSEQQIREQITQDAILAAYPYALGIGAVSGVFGPEALLARTSVLQPLLKGGIGRRVLTGAVLSAIEEGVTEGAEQLNQNIAWNDATKDQKDIMSGVVQAAGTGALIGAVTGGAGGIRANVESETGTQPPTGSPSNTAPTPTANQAEVGVGRTQVTTEGSAATDLTNPNYNAGTVAQAQEAAQLVRAADAAVQDLVAKGNTVDQNNIAPILNMLWQAEQRGVNRERILERLGNLQNTLNIPTESNLNIPQLYQAWTDALRNAPVDNVATPTASSPATESAAASRNVPVPAEMTQALQQMETNVEQTAPPSAPEPSVPETKPARAPYVNLAPNRKNPGSRGHFLSSGDTAQAAQHRVNMEARGTGLRTEQAATNPDAAVQEQAVVEGVERIMARQLEAAGRDPAQAAREATVLAGMLDTLAKAEGLTVSEAAQRIGFQMAPEGIVESSLSFLPDGSIELIFGSGVDVGTAIHNFQRIFIQEANRILSNSDSNIDPTLRVQLQSDIETLAAWAGVTDGNWTDANYTKVGKAFEAYFRRGKAPNEALANVFADMREMLLTLYRHARDLWGRSKSPKIGSEVRAVFDRQLIGYDNEQLRQTSPAEARGTDSLGDTASGEPAANQPGLGAATVTGSNAGNTGNNPAAQGTGSGGAAYQSTGAPVGNLQLNFPARGNAEAGTVSGRSDSGNAPGSAETNTGERSVTGTPEQRPGNDGRTENAGGLEQTRLTVEQYREQQLQSYLADGMDQQNAELLADQAAAIYSTQTPGPVGTNITLDEQAEIDALALDTKEKAMKAGMDEQAATVYARMWRDASTSFADMSQTEQAKASVRAEGEASTDYTATVIEKADAAPESDIMTHAIDEATQNDSDADSPMALYGAIDAETEADLHAGIHSPEVQVNLDESKNGVMMDSESFTTGRGAEGNPEPHMPTAQETEAEIDALNDAGNAIMMESGVAMEGGTQTNPDGTVDVTESKPIPKELQPIIKDIARILAERGRQFSEAFVYQAARKAYLHKKFHDTKYAPRWIAGRWAKFATKLRGSWMDSGAEFRTWLLEHHSAANQNPDHSPIIQAFETLGNRINGEATALTMDVIEPVCRWASSVAGRLNISVDTLMNDMGQFATALHTLEAEPMYRANLENAVSEAYLLPDGDGKKDAVKRAEQALDKYLAWQSGNGEQVDTYGGRSIAEAQQILDDMSKKYSPEILAEGRQLLGNGFDSVTAALIQNGQIDQQTVNSWPSWMYYVALTTSPDNATGAANDVTVYMPRSTFHREGSSTPAQNAWAALIQYTSRAARSIGMQEFGTFMNEAYLLHASDPANVTGELADGRVKFFNGIARIDGATIAAMEHADANGLVNAETLKWAKLLREESDMVVRVMEKNEAGQDVVKTYHYMFDKRTHADQKKALRSPFSSADPNVIAQKLTKYTSMYASIYTRLKPAFPVITGFRDTLERIAYLPTKGFVSTDGRPVSGTKIAAQMVGFLANPRNIINLASYFIRGKSFSPYLDTMFNEFRTSGAMYNYNNMLQAYRKKTMTEVNEKHNATLQNLDNKTRKAALEVIGKWGDFWYSLPAFAQYTKMREAGISVEDTVGGVVRLMNMQQGGTLTKKVLAPFFPFTNSISQTAGNLLGSLGLNITAFSNHPNASLMRKNAIKGWAVMIGMGMSIRALIPLIAASLDSGEDDGQKRLDLIPLNQLGTFVPVGLGDGSFVKIPTGFGPFMLSSMMAYGMDRVERGVMSPGDFAATIITSFGKTLIPNSAPAFSFKSDPVTYLAHTLSPMLIQPIVQLVSNKTYSGATIRQNDYNDSTRRSDHFNLTTAESWRTAAKWLYEATGMDLAPEEIRTFANGYAGGVFQGVIAWIESDALYKSDMYKSTRDDLGVFWTTLGASSLYNTNMNLSQSSMYKAREHYDGMIRSLGLKLTGKEDEKRRIMAAAGMTIEEIDDYMALYKAGNAISKMNGDVKKRLDALYGPDMDEDTIRRVYGEWSDKRHAMQTEVVNKLNYFNAAYRNRHDVADRGAVSLLRGEVYGAPAVPGNIDLNNRPVVRMADGSIATVRTVSFQDRDGLEVNVPTIGPNGEVWSNEEAWENYLRTGQHLGKYRTVEAAQRAAEQLHLDQERMYAR